MSKNLGENRTSPAENFECVNQYAVPLNVPVITELGDRAMRVMLTRGIQESRVDKETNTVWGVSHPFSLEEPNGGHTDISIYVAANRVDWRMRHRQNGEFGLATTPKTVKAFFAPQGESWRGRLALNTTVRRQNIASPLGSDYAFSNVVEGIAEKLEDEDPAVREKAVLKAQAHLDLTLRFAEGVLGLQEMALLPRYEELMTSSSNPAPETYPKADHLQVGKVVRLDVVRHGLAISQRASTLATSSSI